MTLTKVKTITVTHGGDGLFEYRLPDGTRLCFNYTVQASDMVENGDGDMEPSRYRTEVQVCAALRPKGDGAWEPLDDDAAVSIMTEHVEAALAEALHRTLNAIESTGDMSKLETASS